MSPLSRRDALAWGLGGLLAASGARAADKPRILYGFAPGPGGSVVLEELMGHMQEFIDQPLPSQLTIVQGQGGVKAVEALLKAPADGSQVLLSPNSTLTLIPQLRKLPFDANTAITPVASVTVFTFALCVGPAVPKTVNTVQDYASWLRSKPEGARYGVPALGSSPHFVGMQLARALGIPMRAEGYPGTIPLRNEVLSGALPAGFILVNAAAGPVKSGELRALGVASAARWPGLEQVPTFLEQDLKMRPVEESFGLYMSAQAPAEKVDLLNQAVRKMLAKPAVQTLLANFSFRPGAGSASSFRGQLVAEQDMWKELIAQERFTLDA